MTYPNHDDAIRTSLRRVSVTKVDDSGQANSNANQQLVDATGYDSDAPRQMVRIQSHGFSSNPPEGSEGLALALGGRSDRLHVLGLEHSDHRPKNLPSGETALYNAGSVMMQTKGDDLNLSANGTHTMTVKSLVVKCGGVTVTIDGNGIAIMGGKVTHNGHDIGQTHQHTQTMPGAGLSGVPQ